MQKQARRPPPQLGWVVAMRCVDPPSSISAWQAERRGYSFAAEDSRPYRSGKRCTGARMTVQLAKSVALDRLVRIKNNKMKARTFTTLLWIVLATTGFGRIGENEKQIEARYGAAGKVLGDHGNVHEVGYASGGFVIMVDYVNGISQREGFANPDTSPLSQAKIDQILAMNAPEGTTWKEGKAEAGDRMWARTDEKAIAVFPARGTFLFVQDVEFVQPKQ
jgi:hypothetical protein